MQDLNDLYYFVKVVEHGGFAAAGRALGVPKSKLSRRIALLEDGLGVRLLQRSTRRFQVTEVGQEYYRHCAAMLIEADAAQEAVERMRSTPQGLVRVTCPSSILYFQIGEMLARFMTQYPRVRVELESTNRYVDLLADHIDVAIRIQSGPLAGAELAVKVLADLTYRLVAHPRLLEGRPPVVVPADLKDLPSVDIGPPGRKHEWCLEGPRGANALVPHTPRLVTEDMVALRFAALEGVGIAQLPATVVRPDLLSGRLAEVMPRWVPRREWSTRCFPRGAACSRQYGTCWISWRIGSPHCAGSSRRTSTTLTPPSPAACRDRQRRANQVKSRADCGPLLIAVRNRPRLAFIQAGTCVCALREELCCVLGMGIRNWLVTAA